MKVHIPGGADIGERGDADPITKILTDSKTIAVVGLSSNPMRPSFGVTEYMQEAGYRIIPKGRVTRGWKRCRRKLRL